MVARPVSPARVQMNKTRLVMLLGAVLMAACGVLALVGSRTQQAQAAINCVPHQNTAEELQFISLLQEWRDSNIPGSHPLTRSISLNKAAWHYARFLADNPGAGGHWAEPGFTSGAAWAARAAQCGYPVPAGGEGLAVVESSQPIDISPAAAIDIMAAQPGGGIYTPAFVGSPATACVGAAKAVSGDGRKVAWVTLLFGTWNGCADPDTSNPPAPSPPGGSATTSATTTPTKTPTPTPTATPTPLAEYGVTITVCGGWNLLTIPVAGDVDDVFDTALLDVAAIYLQNGEGWLRWAPDVPAYARNLSRVSSGDVLWIYRSEPSCEDIEL